MEKNPEQLEQLDERTYTLSSAFYQSYQHNEPTHFTTIGDLDRTIHKLIRSHQTIEAVYLIKNNISLIKENIDLPSTSYFLTLLLDNNELQTAAELYDAIQLLGNTIVMANSRFAMAKYTLKRNKWQQTLDYLKGISGKLTDEDSEHATLIEGFALQKLKRHRDAIAIYEKSSKNSTFYPLSATNLAVAFIRQDWWTDGHLALTQLLNEKESQRSDELDNRIHVTLGYSLMRKEYYRDAREAFRKVSLESQYTNRALLGIALTAINQNDFVGALNAINILKAKNSYDLPAEEAYLLQPYIYSKLQQHLTSSAGFNEAISHYQKRIKEIESILKLQDGITNQLKTRNNSLMINHYRFDLSQHYPPAFLENFQLVKKLANQAQGDELKQSLQLLEKEYRTILIEIAHRMLNERIAHLNSYIDQSRYGLALLFDNSLAE